MELMFSVIVYIIAAFIFAAITLSYAILIGYIQNPKIRNHLPWLCGVLLVCLIYLVQDSKAAILVLFAVPFFIYTPVPFIEKVTGSIFSKKSIYYGAVLISLYYFGMSTAGTYFFNLYEKSDSLFWIVGTIVPAFLIFLGISLYPRFLTDNPKNKAEDTKADSDTKSQRSEDRMAVVLILGFILFCIPLYLIVSPGETETAAGFNVYSIQESETDNGTILHLTDKDFWEFPKLAPIIRDGRYNGCYSDSANCIAHGSYSFGEEQKYRYYSASILEYRDRYYSLKKTWIT
jgi:hypothetical protein